jgi:outer membrane protein OmpA-like peptidoglycan-associated protein
MRYLTRYLLTTVAITACASTQRPNAALTEARRIYGALDLRGAARRLDADMERTRAAIDRADSAATARTNVDYLNAVSDIALHLAQATEAKDDALAAQQAADSLRAARLRRLLGLSESQRADLASQNALSQAELEALREQNLAARQREDSTRVAQNAAAGVRATEDVRADSLRRVAEQATKLLEAARTDSAQRASAESARELDSLRTAAQAATRAADSLRDVATAAARARDSLRALNTALSALQTTSTGVRTVRQTDRGLVISLSGVLFDVGTSTLTPGAARSVRRIAEVLQQYPNYHLTVEGHTDSRGRPERNQALSERRAEAVKEALIAGGLEADHIATQGYGATQPVTSNATTAGRQQNRRVEIVVVGAS